MIERLRFTVRHHAEQVRFSLVPIIIFEAFETAATLLPILERLHLVDAILDAQILHIVLGLRRLKLIGIGSRPIVRALIWCLPLVCVGEVAVRDFLRL